MINHHRHAVTVLANGDGARKAARCPVCASNDRAEKASSIVRTGRGSMMWMDGEVAQYESDAAQLLAEPALPRAVPLAEVVTSSIISWLVLAATIAAVTALRQQTFFDVPKLSLDAATAIGVLWFGLIAPGIAFLRYSQNVADIREATPRWRTARARWAQLYYCSRDDVVFIDNEALEASPENVAVLLYPNDERSARRVNRKMLDEEPAIGVAG